MIVNVSFKRVRTRKPHRCWGCTRQVPVGTDIECSTMAFDGSISSSYWCDECIAIFEREKLKGLDPEEMMAGDLREYYPAGALDSPIAQKKPALEPADDPRHPGNHSRYKRYGQKCETLGCERTPGTYWGPYFCQPCNGERLRRITSQLEAIVARHSVEVKPEEQAS